MVFYVAYRASKGYKNRGLVPKRLKALGCRCIYRSFWEVDDDKVDKIFRFIRENQPILLKRSREVRKPRFDEEDNLTDFGSLIVVVYSAEEDEKGKIRRLLRKTPYIRLCRSVYAFCQSYHRYDKSGDLVDISRFFTFVREIDEDAKIFPRMTIVNSDSIDILLERVKVRVEKGVDEVIKGYKSLLQKAVNKKLDKRYLMEEEKKLYRKFLSIRRIANFYEKWLKIDLTKAKLKIYPITRKLQYIKMVSR